MNILTKEIKFGARSNNAFEYDVAKKLAYRMHWHLIDVIARTLYEIKNMR